jgi:hypothetical protein
MMCCLDTFLIFDRGLSSYMIWVSLLFHEQVVYKTSADTCRKLRLLIDECHYPSASVFVKIIMLNLLRVCVCPSSLLQRARGNGSALLGMSMSWAVGQGRDDQAGENWRSTRGVRCTYTMKYALTFLRLFVSNRQTANFGLGVHASYKSYHVGFPTLFQKGP